MAAVQIRCPETGELVSTGFETDADSFRALPDVRSRMSCPACGKTHWWRPADATLEGEESERSRPDLTGLSAVA